MRSPTLFCEMFDAQRIKRIAGVLRIWWICYCYSVIGFQVTVCLLWQLMNWDTRWDCHTSKILLLSFTPVTGPTVAHSPLYLEITRLVSKSSMVRDKLHILRIKFKKCPNEGGIISLLPGISRRDVEIQPVPDKCDPRVGLNAALEVMSYSSRTGKAFLWRHGRRTIPSELPLNPFEVSTQRQVWRTTGATLGQCCLMLLMLMQACCTYSQVKDSSVLYSLVWLHWGSTSLFYHGTDTSWSSRVWCILMLDTSVIMVSPQASNK